MQFEKWCNNILEASPPPPPPRKCEYSFHNILAKKLKEYRKKWKYSCKNIDTLCEQELCKELCEKSSNLWRKLTLCYRGVVSSVIWATLTPTIGKIYYYWNVFFFAENLSKQWQIFLKQFDCYFESLTMSLTFVIKVLVGAGKDIIKWSWKR